MRPTLNPTTKTDQVGRTGIYPMSGPWPPGDARVVGQEELGKAPTARAWKEYAPIANRNAALTAGRLVFGGFFLYNGLNHFLNRTMMVDYARSKNVPLPNAAVVGSGALLLLGGLSLITGVRPRVGAALVTTFLTGVTPVMHNFWTIEEEPQRTNELINLTKNVALIGGAAFAASVPEPWPYTPATVYRS